MIENLVMAVKVVATAVVIVGYLATIQSAVRSLRFDSLHRKLDIFEISCYSALLIVTGLGIWL